MSLWHAHCIGEGAFFIYHLLVYLAAAAAAKNLQLKFCKLPTFLPLTTHFQYDDDIPLMETVVESIFKKQSFISPTSQFVR